MPSSTPPQSGGATKAAQQRTDVTTCTNAELERLAVLIADGRVKDVSDLSASDIERLNPLIQQNLRRRMREIVLGCMVRHILASRDERVAS